MADKTNKQNVIEISDDDSIKVDENGFPLDGIPDFSEWDEPAKPADITIDEATYESDNNMCSGGCPRSFSLDALPSGGILSSMTPPFRGRGKRCRNRRVSFNESVSVETIERSGFIGSNLRTSRGGRFRPGSNLAEQTARIEISGTYRDLQEGAFERINTKVISGGPLGQRSFGTFLKTCLDSKREADHYKKKFYEQMAVNNRLNKEIENNANKATWGQAMTGVCRMINEITGQVGEVVDHMAAQGKIEQDIAVDLKDILNKN